MRRMFWALIALGIATSSAVAQKKSATLLIASGLPASKTLNPWQGSEEPQLSLALPPARMPAAAGMDDSTSEAQAFAMTWSGRQARWNPTGIASFHPDTGNAFDFFGEIFDAVNFEWPIGVSQSVHIHMPMTTNETGKLVPFVSLFQDMDEVDEHIRNGAGGGFSMNVDRSTSVGIEGQYLDGAGEANPALEHESRVMVWISGQF